MGWRPHPASSSTERGSVASPTPTSTPHRQRERLLASLGLPAYSSRIHEVLEQAMDEADGLAPAGLTVLDAGCGHKTPLLPLRRRIRRLVGIDLHEPEEIPPYLDAFAPVDLCKPTRAFPPAQFDVVFANFVLEHLDVPDAALSSLARWLRPHGVFVATTVNRRHPFVAAYLAMPARIRDRLQPVVKATSADAHRLVGRCNDPAAIRFALDDTGFDRVELETIGNLARGWKHNPLTFALGILGDLLMRSSPLGRSTIIVVARRRERLTS